MKAGIRYIAGLLLFCMAFFVSGCRSEGVIEPSPQKNDYSVISTDDSQKEKITSAVKAYLLALEQKNQEGLSGCTTEDMSLYRNETAFDDLTNEISGARLDRIDFENVQMKDDRLLVAVEYTLSYEGSSTDEQGSLREPGEYNYMELFTLLESDGEYKIEKTEPTAAG